ncbi:MAG: LLM class flavin-dependent oxidoreductase [Hyphomicrobiaceae bacterium]
MPARIIGMLGVTPPKSDATLLVIEGELSPPFVVEFAQTHEAAGFDMALVGYSSSSAEGFLVAQHAAHHTERLSFLIAHRPGFVAPTLFARKVATFDHLTGGRIALHIITGKTDAEQQGDGDFSPKAERYVRAQEYLHLMKRTWAADTPFDFDGAFYKVRGAQSDVRPLQQPHPLLMFGGASEGALVMGAAECDVFAIYAEPLATTAERIAEFRARAATYNRRVGFNMSVRPIIAETEGAAWDKAHHILAQMTGKLGWKRQEDAPVAGGQLKAQGGDTPVAGGQLMAQARAPVDNAGRRQFQFALDRDVHDTRLWMGITKATGALGNTSCLVGTAEQVAAAILEYYRLGIDSFLIRGFDPVGDTTVFGRELIPRIKAGALEIDKRLAAE